MEGQLPTIVDAEIETFVTNVEVLVKKQFDKAKQYFKLPSASEVEMLQRKLVAAEQAVEHLKSSELGVVKAVAPFSKEDFKSDEFTRFYIGIPNVGYISTFA